MFRMIFFISLLIAAIFLSGCSGYLYTYPDANYFCHNDEGNKNLDKNDIFKCNKYEGVLYYPLKNNESKYYLNQITNDKNEIVKYYPADTFEKLCKPVNVTETKMVSDYDNPSLIQYKPAFFETSKFNVELDNNGRLIKVGSDSTPGGKTMAETAAIVVSTVASVVTLMAARPENLMLANKIDKVLESVPQCTTGKVPGHLDRKQAAAIR
ncbi:hypothetical protein [Azomonas macrocytogenes]|uniref:Lipoprotein n=1 Tax=Azomonas macrocytogenes TaxID=69962 RepID=A0A839T712_AZOMA|nr:hypothetical protein [Azomonas macrocytogenes]MBB3103745.1 hypothetical protein [Azomonas macrocytogenes]